MACALVAALLLAACAGPATSTPTPRERRASLLREADGGAAAIPQLVRALDDSNVVVRRTAARLLAEIGEAATDALPATLTNDDLLVRRTGLVALCRLGGDAALAAVEAALGDTSAVVRLVAVQYLASSRPHSDAVLALLERACDDDSDKVRVIANRATWPFYRDSASIRDRQRTDRDIVVTATIPLPKEGWRFRLDPRREGHRLDWFSPAFDDGDWDTIAIEQAWQAAGYEHTGVAWYRRAVEVPAAAEHIGVDLRFEGVDESTWVWLNGVYVGDHDVGPSGWNQPFRLDISEILRWGEPNHIVVRAMNTAHAGGIWKPVQIEVLR